MPPKKLVEIVELVKTQEEKNKQSVITPEEILRRVSNGKTAVSLEDIKVVLQEVKNINETDDQKRSALHIAASHGQPEIFNLLIEHKARHYQKDNNEKDSLTLVVEYIATDVAKQFEKVNPEKLHAAVTNPLHTQYLTECEDRKYKLLLLFSFFFSLVTCGKKNANNSPAAINSHVEACSRLVKCMNFFVDINSANPARAPFKYNLCSFMTEAFVAQLLRYEHFNRGTRIVNQVTVKSGENGHTFAIIGPGIDFENKSGGNNISKDVVLSSLLKTEIRYFYNNQPNAFAKMLFLNSDFYSAELEVLTIYNPPSTEGRDEVFYVGSDAYNYVKGLPRNYEYSFMSNQHPNFNDFNYSGAELKEMFDGVKKTFLSGDPDAMMKFLIECVKERVKNSSPELLSTVLDTLGADQKIDYLRTLVQEIQKGSSSRASVKETEASQQYDRLRAGFRQSSSESTDLKDGDVRPKKDLTHSP